MYARRRRMSFRRAVAAPYPQDETHHSSKLFAIQGSNCKVTHHPSLPATQKYPNISQFHVPKLYLTKFRHPRNPALGTRTTVFQMLADSEVTPSRDDATSISSNATPCDPSPAPEGMGLTQPARAHSQQAHPSVPEQKRASTSRAAGPRGRRCTGQVLGTWPAG